MDDNVKRIIEEKGTEAPFSGKYYNHFEDGVYTCVKCGKKLFSSESKYDSGSGWPSFDSPIKNENITYTPDNSLGMERMEVSCSNCGAHLGHVFPDGPKETTGKRYCVNSLSLNFKKDE